MITLKDLIKAGLFKKFTGLFTFILTLSIGSIYAQSNLDSVLPVRGLCIAAPTPDYLDTFVDFINRELNDLNVNTLVLRVDYRYAYQSHPELRNNNPLTIDNVSKIVSACRQNNIRLIPQINLLGHQSWAGNLNPLLAKYPQFDETPGVEMPEKYEWPNEDGLYCKSYCPNHPDVHMVIFALVDELLEVFKADAFHAGMDEVFYLADADCPRCGGLDPATVFADEVKRIYNHLKSKNVEMWIWGDRLIDGKITGLGMWQASMNNTSRAIEMIPKEVVICDWHYQRATPTAPYFAIHGFQVITCPYRLPEVGLEQLENMLNYRANSPSHLKEKFLGIMQTAWGSARSFVESYRNNDPRPHRRGGNVQMAFRKLFEAMNNLEE